MKPSYCHKFIKQPKGILRIFRTHDHPLVHINNLFSYFHTSSHVLAKKEKKDLVPTDKEILPRMRHFEGLKTKDKKTFLKIIETYNEQDKMKRGHLEFIYAALKYMEDFGVDGDLETYKALMNVFPKGKMIPKNLIQAEFYHFIRHQECALYILDKMDYSGIIFFVIIHMLIECNLCCY